MSGEQTTEVKTLMTMSPIAPTPTPGSDSNGTLVLVPRIRNAAGKFVAINEIDRSMGGREKVIQQLEFAPPSAKMEILMSLLADPGRSHLGLPEIAKDAGISAREFMSILREASVAKAFAEANQALSEKLAKVVEDVSEKAANHVENCECTLGGLQVADEKCPECKGRGLRYYRGNLQHQQMVFESTGLLKRGGGVNVSVNQQVAVGGSGLFERFVKATDAAAYGAKVIDAEVETDEKAGSGENRSS